MKKRAVICHYHIFKNSGSTFDTLLKLNYAEQFLSFDGPFTNFIIEQDQLERIIFNHPDVIAFSSHQIRLPIPVSLDFLVLPIIFIRHPLLRVRSVYQFTRIAQDETLITKTARNLSFDEWVNNALITPSLLGEISNVQTSYLSGVYQRKWLRRTTPTGIEYDIHQAIRNIQNVQLLGRTEYFNEDIKVFSMQLSYYNIKFITHAIPPQNVTSNDLDLPLDERLKQIQDSLSKSTYKKLADANYQDLHLYNYISYVIENNSYMRNPSL
jgi:hypothetical protein